MKLTPVVLGMLAGLASVGVQASEMQFYGRIDYSVTNSDSGSATHDGKSGTILENNFTRVGIRGEVPVNDALAFFYRIELGVNGDDQDGKTVSSRPTYAGLKHSTFGSLAFGRIDPVFKMSKGFADAFDNYSLKHDRLFAGDKRHGDSLEYRTAKFSGLQFGLSYLLEDDYYSDDDPRKDNGNYQLALTYGDKKFKHGNLYLAAAYSDGIEDIEATRVVAHYKMNDWTFGTIMQQSELVNPNAAGYGDREGFGYIVSTTYQMGGWKLKAQYGEDDSGTGKIAGRVYGKLGGQADVVPTVSQWAVGAEYRFTKQLRLHTELGQFSVDEYSEFDDTITSVGLRYDF
ncbi:porin [Ferrimonas sp. YFM]|uniref:porin n=1 Tax=Ferrimonas sp. YFM TaxID=3028878 RepID=UPI0025744DE8|nr:porin [Ferrimonas sp. YFM]BDY04577.1 porin [Ferrimonas sp. YFM]